MTNQSQPASSEAKLTAIQQQRYDLIFPNYGPVAKDIVINVYGKGKHSWDTFLEKMDSMLEAKRHDKDYYDALYDTFEIGVVYTPGQIIGKVNETRRQLGLPIYTEKIKLQSEQDFNLLFLVQDCYEPVAEDDVRKVLSGYRPLVRTMPEE